jgi:Leucine-rich repeat (LRR) protein
MADLSLACKHLRSATDVGRLLEGQDLSQLTGVVLSSNELLEDPFTEAQAKEMTYVTKLVLGFNKLAVFPRSVLRFDELMHLHLNNNAIEDVPAELCGMTRLATLNLSRNNISALPADIGNLKQLVHLNVSDNKLASVPSSICFLRSLKVLVLSNNRLTALPHDMDRLQALEGIRLADNLRSAFWSENRAGTAAVQHLLAQIAAPFARQRALYCVLAIHRFRSDECPDFARIPRDVLRFVFAPLLAAAWPKVPDIYATGFNSFNK